MAKNLEKEESLFIREITFINDVCKTTNKGRSQLQEEMILIVYDTLWKYHHRIKPIRESRR